MNAGETTAAAIEKLYKIKVDSTPGPWTFHCASTGIRGSQSYSWILDATERIPLMEKANGGTDADMKAAITLHRTIDAQLTILRDFQDRYLEFGRIDGWVPASPTARAALDLARAILGEES